MALLMLDVRVVMVSCSSLNNLILSCCGFLVKAREEHAADLRNSLLVDELQSLVNCV